MHTAESSDSSPAGRRKAAVLFDVDGTLVDSTYLHTLAWWQAFRQAGYDVPMAGIHRCVGMGGDKILARLLPAGRDMSGDDAILTSHAAVFSTFWPALRPLDGAKELLAQCFESGLAVAADRLPPTPTRPGPLPPGFAYLRRPAAGLACRVLAYYPGGLGNFRQALMKSASAAAAR